MRYSCLPLFFSQATHHPFYLHVGREILRDIEKHSKVKYVTFKMVSYGKSLVHCLGLEKGVGEGVARILVTIFRLLVVQDS